MLTTLGIESNKYTSLSHQYRLPKTLLTTYVKKHVSKVENTLVLENTRKRTHSKNEAGHRSLCRELRNNERTVQTTKFTQTGCLTSIKGRVCTGKNIATLLHTTRNTKVVATLHRRRSLFPTEKFSIWIQRDQLHKSGLVWEMKIIMRDQQRIPQQAYNPSNHISQTQIIHLSFLENEVGHRALIRERCCSLASQNAHHDISIIPKMTVMSHKQKSYICHS